MVIGVLLGIMLCLTFFSMIKDAGTLIPFSSQFYGYTFSVSAIEGTVLVIVLIIIGASLVGVNVFGSGLNEASTRQLSICIAYAGLWSLLSVLSYDFFVSIEIFGLFIWLGMSVAYSIGVVHKISGGS